MRTGHFTGWHMTAILVSFFAVVVGVNLYMARAAVGTFGGTVVDNSYVASQRFNQWLDKADAQKSLGWTVTAKLSADRHIDVAAGKRGVRLDGVTISAVVRHPLGRAPEQVLAFQPQAGRWVSTTPLPPGRWLVHLSVVRGADRYQTIETLQ